MNIKPIASPADIKVAPPSNTAARAIEAFNKASNPQPEQPIVQNQTQVTPEELGAIKAPQRQPDEIVEPIQADTEEEATTPPPKPEPTEEEQRLSRQFAQLARQEKAIRQKAQQLQQQEQAIKAREAELSGKPQFDPKQYYTKDQVKQDALSILADAGVSYEELTQQIISQQPTDPRVQRTITQLQEQIQELKSAREADKKSQEESQSTQYQAALRQIESDTTSLINAEPEEYEAIRKTGKRAVKEVVRLIKDTYDKDGILLTVEEASKRVEDYLVEENYNMANNINKIKRRLTEVAPKSTTSTAQTAAKPQQPQPMKTLTNAASSVRKLSAKERAILVFKGEKL